MPLFRIPFHLFVVPVLLAGCTPVSDQPATTPAKEKRPFVEYREAGLPDGLGSFFDELTVSINERMNKHSIPGLAIAVTRRDRVLWKAGFGVRDRRTGDPVDSYTIFSLQSISKNMTSTALMLDVQEHNLQLDQTVAELLPNFKIKSRFAEHPEKRMTIANLVYHKAGFTHEAPVGNNYDASADSFDAHVASISKTWLKYPVGARFSYSNLGIDLLGYVLQENSGQSFDLYMRERVFDPLGLATAFIDKPGQDLCDLCAHGHWKPYSSLPSFVPMAGAGGVRMSVDDAAHYLQFYLNQGSVGGRQVLEKKYVNQIYRPSGRDPRWPSGIWGGMNVALMPVGDTYRVVTNGAGFGYSASMMWLPEYGLGVVVLTNSMDHPQIDVQTAMQITDRVVHDGLLQKLSDPSIPSSDEAFAGTAELEQPVAKIATEPTFTKPEWSKYTGKYYRALGGGFELVPSFDPSPFAISVFEKENVLYIRDGIASQPEALVEYFPAVFFGTSSGEALDFRGDQPTWAGVRLRQPQLFRYKDKEQ